MKFSYAKWALETAWLCLRSDHGCGLDVADDTPNPEKAHAAFAKLIERLRREAERHPGSIEFSPPQPTEPKC